MSHQSRFPINEPFYEVRQIKDFKDLIDQSENLFSERPAYKLKNKDGVYYEVTYKNFRHAIYYLANILYSMSKSIDILQLTIFLPDFDKLMQELSLE